MKKENGFGVVMLYTSCLPDEKLGQAVLPMTDLIVRKNISKLLPASFLAVAMTAI
jgi:hypothetical protein